MRLAILLALAGVVTIGAILLFSVDEIPPHDLTKGRVLLTEQRMRLFWEKNGRVPPDLNNLPLLPGRDNETKDAWGQKLEYKVNGNKVTLWSTGKSGAVSKRESGFTNTFDVTKPLL